MESHACQSLLGQKWADCHSPWSSDLVRDAGLGTRCQNELTTILSLPQGPCTIKCPSLRPSLPSVRSTHADTCLGSGSTVPWPDSTQPSLSAVLVPPVSSSVPLWCVLHPVWLFSQRTTGGIVHNSGTVLLLSWTRGISFAQSAARRLSKSPRRCESPYKESSQLPL